MILSFVVCLLVLVTSGAPLRRYCSRDNSAFSAVDMVLHNIALYTFPTQSIPFHTVVCPSVHLSVCDAGHYGLTIHPTANVYEQVNRKCSLDTRFYPFNPYTDRLWAGKPFRYVSSQLSLPFLRGR